jgi:hypothetical protein
VNLNHSEFSWSFLNTSVADPYHIDADPDADLDHACHFDADPDPACHFDADPDPNPTVHFHAGPIHILASK